MAGTWVNGVLREALQRVLGERLALPKGEDEGVPVATPRDERELIELVNLVRQHGGALGRDVRVSRTALDVIGVIDAKSGVVQVGAGVTLVRLEQELRLRDLSLGPLPPSLRRAEVTVADYLEGHWAGLRAMPGGRMETSCLAVNVVMPDGLRFVSRPSPRSAAGPDLDQLFLGGGGRFGLMLSATLRVFTRPRADREIAYAFESVEALVSALRTSLFAGVWFERVTLGASDVRWILWGKVIGSADGVERDLASAGHAFSVAGGRPVRMAEPVVPSSLGGEGAEEHELSWDALQDALRSGGIGIGGGLTLYRAGLESALVTGLHPAAAATSAEVTVDAGASDVLLRVLAEADPQNVMGGMGAAGAGVGGRP